MYKRRTKVGLVAFGGPRGRWSVPGPLKSEQPGCFLRALGRHLVDLGRRFGAHWDFEGIPKVDLFEKINIRWDG